MYFTVLLLKISTVWKWNKFWELELVPDLTAFRWNNVRLTVSRTCLQSEAVKGHFKHPQMSNKGYDWPSPYSLQLTVCSITTNRNPPAKLYDVHTWGLVWQVFMEMKHMELIKRPRAFLWAWTAAAVASWSLNGDHSWKAAGTGEAGQGDSNSDCTHQH